MLTQVPIGLLLLSGVPSIEPCEGCLGEHGLIEAPTIREPHAYYAEPTGFHAYLSTAAGNSPLNFLRTVDAGVSWSLPNRIDEDPGFTLSNSHNWLGGAPAERLIAAWMGDPSGGGPSTLLSRVSPDRGQSWPARAVPITALGGYPIYPAVQFLTRPSGEVWVTWLDGPSDADVRLRFSVTHDGGQSWEPPAVFPPTAAVVVRSYQLKQLTSGDLLLVYIAAAVADEDRAYITRSEDNGGSWTPGVELTGRAGRAYLPGMEVLVGAGDKVLAWWLTDQDGGYDAYSRLSVDGGRTWFADAERIDAGDAAGSSYAGGGFFVDQAGPGDQIVAIWVDNRDGARRVYSNHSVDFGQSWGVPAGAPAKPLSVNASDAYPSRNALVVHPEIGWVSVTWHDEQYEAMSRCGRPTRCLATYLARSCDGGASWEAPVRFLDVPDGIGQESPQAMPDGAISLVLGTLSSQIRAMRIDGASRTAALGPTVYCIGNDPALETRMVSAHCPAGFAWQWYVDGVAVPGATATVYRPSLAAGKHTVEARGTCLSDPTCAPAAIPVELEAVAPGVPPDVGNKLRAVRDGSTAAVLSWHDLVTAASRHFHLRRAFAKGVVGTMIAPDPGLVSRSYRDEPPAAERLVLYDLRQTTPCEDESRN